MSPGEGEKMKHHMQVKFTAFMVLNEAILPSDPIVSLVFKIRRFAEIWRYETVCKMLLDGNVIDLPIVVAKVPTSEAGIVEEKAMILLNAKQAAAFLESKECAFKIGRDEFDVLPVARKPASEVIARFRSELAAGTFNDLLPSKEKGKIQGK